MSSSPQETPERGAVTLVALCFVTVLGITLAGYIAVCSRAMNLSNRSYQDRTSLQLAEMGIDEALRAFNTNNWTTWTNGGITVTWDTSTYAASKRAVASIAFPTGKFGQAATGSVKIRVDNYDANALSSAAYNASTTYRANDVVYYNATALVAGSWYRYINASSTSGNAPLTALGYPNLSYWVPVGIPWMWSANTTYSQYAVVNYGGTWYYSNISSNTSTPNVANWTAMPAAPTLAITTFTTYTAGQFGFRVGDSTWYRCTTSFTSTGSWDASKWTTAAPILGWAYKSANTYSYNDVVFYSGTAGVAGTWYRCIAATSAGNAPTNTTYWENAFTGINTTTTPGVYGWSSSSIKYNLGDTVCYYTSSSYNFYRCIRSHTSSGSILPTNTTYWTNTPLHSTAWDSAKTYSANDTVRYNGQWYLALSSNTATVPVTNHGTWALAPRLLENWLGSKYYYANDMVSKNGIWYRCVVSNANQDPVFGSYWVATGGASYQWNAATAYAIGDYRCYDGAWYKCTAATTANAGQTPNNTNFWSAAWVNSSGVTTGAPVVYAEGTIDIAGSPSIKTQLRASIAPAPLFPNALGSTSTISAGSGGTVDSYDSTTDPSASTPGYSAVVAAGYTGGTAVTLVGAITISGYVAAPSASTPAPYAPLFSYGTSTVVKGTSATPSPKIDVSRVGRSPSIPQFDTLPSGGLTAAFSASNFYKGTLLALPSGSGNTVNLGTPGATTPSRYYYVGDLAVSDSSSVKYLNINGPVILYISGDLTVDGDGTSPDGVINITSAGSAEIHIGDSLQVLQNSDGIRNLTLDPKKLIIICDTAASGSAQSYGDGGYQFYGTIYAPNTTHSNGLNFNNTISPSATTCTVYGALSANKITYTNNNNMNVHYDTSLRYATFGGVDQPYTATEWRELPIDEQATMP